MIKKLLIGAYLLNAFDALSTYFLVGIKKYVVEANPLMAALIHYGGWTGFLLFKLGALAATYLFILENSHRYPRLSKWASIVFFSSYAALAIYHIIFWILLCL